MPTADQKTRAETYRNAAIQHSMVARDVYDLGWYAPANYLSGLAVECMLRAYRLMIDPEFDARHDLDHLFRLARFANVVPEQQVEEIGAALGDVIALWSNDHRYLDDVALRKRWAKRRLYTGVKGDFLKERVRQLVNAATDIVTIGAARWKTYFKS